MRFSSAPRKRLPGAVSVLLITSVLFCGAIPAAQVDVTYHGPAAEDGSPYNASFNWSPQVVPNNGNGGNTYRVIIASGGPKLDIDATVDALTLQGNGSLNGTDHSFTSAVTRNDTSAFALSGEGLNVSTYYQAVKVDFGSLANYNSVTNTLEGGFYRLTGSSTLSFNGANIVTNSAGIHLRGRATITNEAGANALQSRAVNNGVLDLQQAFQTAGDFTNNGELLIGTANFIVPSLFTVTRKLTN